MPPKHRNAKSTSKASQKSASASHSKQFKSESALSAVQENEVLDTPPPLEKTPSQSRAKNDSQNKSQKARSDSASTICGSPKKWELWAKFISFIASRWTKEDFWRFMKDLKYPRFITSDEIVPLLEGQIDDDDIGGLEIQLFKSWRARLRPDELEDEDKYYFQMWLSNITATWKALQRQVNNKEGETGCRRPIDNLIDLAFGLRRGASQTWRAEKDLALPGKPNVVKADAITTSKLPDKWKRLASSVPNKYTLSWSHQQHEAETIINSTWEYKRYDGKKSDPVTVLNQMMMGQFAAHMQLRALCCNVPVFGGTFCDGELQLYASEHQGEMLNVRTIYDTFVLTDFSSFVRLYFVLCRISEYQEKCLIDEYERWEKNLDDHAAAVRENVEKPWKTRNSRDSPDDGAEEDQHSESEENNESEATNEKEEELVDENETRCIVEGLRQSQSLFSVTSPLTKENRKAYDIVSGYENSDLFLDTPAIKAWAAGVKDCRRQIENQEKDKGKLASNVSTLSGLTDRTVESSCNPLTSTPYDAKKVLMDKTVRVTSMTSTTRVGGDASVIYKKSAAEERGTNGVASPDDETLLGDSIADWRNEADPQLAQISDEVWRPGLKKCDNPGSPKQQAFDAKIWYVKALKDTPPGIRGRTTAPEQNKPSAKLTYAQVLKTASPGISKTRDKAIAQGHARSGPSSEGLGQSQAAIWMRTNVKVH